MAFVHSRQWPSTIFDPTNPFSYLFHHQYFPNVQMGTFPGMDNLPSPLGTVANGKFLDTQKFYHSPKSLSISTTVVSPTTVRSNGVPSFFIENILNENRIQKSSVSPDSTSHHLKDVCNKTSNNSNSSGKSASFSPSFSSYFPSSSSSAENLTRMKQEQQLLLATIEGGRGKKRSHSDMITESINYRGGPQYFPHHHPSDMDTLFPFPSLSTFGHTGHVTVGPHIGSSKDKKKTKKKITQREDAKQQQPPVLLGHPCHPSSSSSPPATSNSSSSSFSPASTTTVTTNPNNHNNTSPYSPTSSLSSPPGNDERIASFPFFPSSSSSISSQSEFSSCGNNDGENEESKRLKSCSVNGQSIRSSKSKRIRTIFKADQLEKLESEFTHQQYMVGPERLALAASLDLSEAQVKVWFQNRRIKWRKTTEEENKRKMIGNPHFVNPHESSQWSDEDHGNLVMDIRVTEESQSPKPQQQSQQQLFNFVH